MGDAGATGEGGSAGDVAEMRGQIAALLPELRGFARFLVRDRGAADDLVQDGLVRALGALHQFEAGTNLKAWLFTILRNAFYENIRRRRRESSLLEAGGAELLSERSAVEMRTDVMDLQSLIWTLPLLLREALILVGAQEMTYEEAAQVCNVPVGTIKARVSRGRSALATALRQAEGQAEGKAGGVHGKGDT